MGGIQISRFEPDDLTPLVALLGRVMPAEGISESRFARQVLLDPNFRPEGLVVARHNGTPIGFVLAIARQLPLENAPPDSERGYITLMAVSPGHQRQSIGSRLLKSAEDHLRSQGRKQVMIASYAPNYFIPGVDVNAYLSALSFFAKHGYAEVYRPLAMQTDLWKLQTPEWVRQKQAELSAQGVAFQSYDSRLTIPLLEFVKREFPGDWVRVVRETAARILQGESPARLVSAIDERSGAVLGFSHFENERFGPIGVAASERGRCIGQVLMYQTLAAQQQSGFRAAWFLWSDDKTAARLYSPAGFRETRRFALLRKDLVDA